MSSGDFKYILVEIPNDITFQYISSLKGFIKEISLEEAIMMQKVIRINVDDIEIEDLREDELFKIGEDSLKIKRGIQMLIEEAIDLVLIPRVRSAGRIGSEIHDKDFGYISIENKTYAISGNQAAYYSSRNNKMYDRLLALNLSGILLREVSEDK